MPTQQEINKSIVVRFNREFIQGGDEALFADTVDPGFVNHSVPADQGTKDASLFWFTKVLRPAFPDLEVTVEDQFADGDTVITRKSYSATHGGPFLGIAPTGRRVDFTVMDIIRLRDGRYIEHWANADMFSLHQQLTRE